MRTPVTAGGSRLLLLVLGVALVLVSGCGGSAFESNDYTMTALTSQPVGKQLQNSSGRASDAEASGLLQAKEIIDEMQHADDWQAKAMGLYDTGDHEEAGELLDEAIALRPDDIGYRTDRALVALAEGDRDEAFVQWEEQDRIAEQNGWTKTEDYWNRQMEDARHLLDVPGRTKLKGMEPVERVTARVMQQGVARVRYGDVLDQVADFREATGESPALVKHTRARAREERARGQHLIRKMEAERTRQME